MANRFPLIVNPVSKRIQELISGDNLDLTGNGLVANNSLGTSGQYLKSNGATVVWDNPGDVYLTATQTISNKTFNTCNISGSTNTLYNIPNSSLVNSSITVNGVAIPLGGSVSTPDNNTTYSVSATDGTDASRKSIRLTSGGTGAVVTDDVTLVAGSNVTLSRLNDEITINSSYIDTNTITRLVASGGTLTSGDITINAATGSTTAGPDGVNTTTGASTVTMSGSTITVGSQYVNTVTRVRGTNSGTYESGDLSILAGTNVTVTPSGKTISISSVDTITRLKANSELDANAVTGIVNFLGSGATTVTRNLNSITISSTDNNTVTSVKANAEADVNAVTGVINITGAGFTTVGRSGNNFTITSTDANTTYSASATGGLIETSTVFSLRNATNLTNNRVLKWDTSNNQLTNSIITDNGITVTIAGNLSVTGTTTTVDSTTLVIADAQIELRKGNSILGSDGGVQVNRTTNSSGVVTSYSAMQWYETGSYWRIFDGTNEKRLVTEGETQTLTNKTLTSPTLNGLPVLGTATATSINGLTITPAVSPVLTILGGKTFTVNKTIALTSTSDGTTVDFGAPTAGSIVAYRSDSLNVFGSTSSSQLAGIITDETGSGSLVFNTSPTFVTSLITTSTSFSLFDTNVTSASVFATATTINVGSASGSTNILGNLSVNGNSTLGDAVSDTINVLGILDSRNNDIRIRGNTVDPMIVGRGGNAIATNTAVGKGALNGVTTGSQNTAVGYEAGFTFTSGASNSAFGWNALKNAGIGANNVAIGKSASVSASDASRNVAIGVSALQDNASGNNNVAIGYFAGAGATGSGNVLIGPAPDANSTNATHTPPTPAGNNQLIIGSGTSTWIRGDSSFDVTLPQNANIGGNLTVSGTLTVNGTVTTINTNVLSIDDKEINLADVVATSFSAATTNGSTTITAINPVANLIPGVQVFITAGATLPANTTIVSITGNTAVLSNPVTGSTGNAAFSANGSTDTTANGGGIRVRGTVDKTLNYKLSTNTWDSSEGINIAAGKQYRIGETAYVTNNFILAAAGTTAGRPASPQVGMIRFNSTDGQFEGYGAVGWAPIGGADLSTYELDNPTGAINGIENTFIPKLNYEKVSITNPFGLLVTVNGIIQSAYINNTDYVFQSSFLGSRDGYTIDYDGNVKFTESLPLGSDVLMRVVPANANASSKSKIYPFTPTDILLGY